MLVLMNLLKINEDEAIYNFGCNEEQMDGVIRINIKDVDKSDIEMMPSNGTVYKSYAYKALAKLIRLALDKKFPDKVQFVS